MLNVVYKLLCLYLLLKPYYIFSSGSLQIGDIILLMAFFIFLLVNKNNKYEIKKILNENKYLIFFMILVFIVNGFYFIYYLKFKFILSSLYYLFNLFIIILFSYMFSKNEKTYNMFDKVLKFNIFIQLLICILNLGDYYGGYRYMGTFNDPNQFAYYIFISFCFTYILNLKLKKSNLEILIFFIISIYLIVRSSSTGMLLGMIVFVILYIILKIKNINKIKKSSIRKKIIVCVALIPIILLSSTLYLNRNEKLDWNNIHILERLNEKIGKLENSNTLTNKNHMTIWQERGYDKIVEYPWYIIYGSGEGMYERFSNPNFINEIHATLPSILFYYGIIPTILLLIWMYKKIKGSPFKINIVFFAIILESFTLLNQRQSLFWIMFILIAKLKSDFKKEENIIN